MNHLESRMKEDKALRDAARALVQADIAHLKSDISDKGIGERMLDNISEGAKDVFESAAETADNHRGTLAALIGAVALWFARNPIMSLFSQEDGEDHHHAEDGKDTTTFEREQRDTDDE